MVLTNIWKGDVLCYILQLCYCQAADNFRRNYRTESHHKFSLNQRLNNVHIWLFHEILQDLQNNF